MVALRDDEIPRLKALYERGVENGVKDLRLVGPEELQDIEPHCRVAIKTSCFYYISHS